MAHPGGLVAAAEKVRRAGRRGDTVLAHISPAEARYFDRLQGGASINPQTGAREYFSLGSIGSGLLRAAGGVVGNYIGGPIGAAVGSAAATALTGGSAEESLTNGFLGGLGAYMGGSNMDLGLGIGGSSLGSSSIFGSLGGETLRHVGGAGSGSANFSGGGWGAGLWDSLTSGNGLAALGLGTVLMAPSDKPKTPTAPTASSSSRSSDANVSYDVEPFDRKRLALGRDPYTYGQTGGEGQMFDVVNPQPVFRAKGGRVKGDTIPGARWRSHGLGRYATGGDVDTRDYFPLDRPAQSYDTGGEHRFFGDQRFADIALDSMSQGNSTSQGTPAAPTNSIYGATTDADRGHGMGGRAPGPGDFSTTDPSRAQAQMGIVGPIGDFATVAGIPGIGPAMGITGALSAMGVTGVVGPVDPSEYDDASREAQQAEIDKADKANKDKDISIGDIAIGALMGAVAPPGVDVAEIAGMDTTGGHGAPAGVGAPGAGEIGPSGVGGSNPGQGTPGSGDVGTVGGSSEAGPGSPGGGGGAGPGAAGEGGAPQGGVGGDHAGQAGYRRGGGVRRMASGGLAAYLRDAPAFSGTETGAPALLGAGSGGGAASGSPRFAPAAARLRGNLQRLQRFADGGSATPVFSRYGQGPAFDFFRRLPGAATGADGGDQPAAPAPAPRGLGNWGQRFDGSRMPPAVRGVFDQLFQRLGGEGNWHPGAIFGQIAQRANPRGYQAWQGLRDRLPWNQPSEPAPAPAEDEATMAKGGQPRGAVKGPGTGQDDKIPALLSDGEYVMDADTVSSLGDGSNDAGAKRLDEMRQRVRQHKRGAPASTIPPKAKPPEQYMGGKRRKKEK